MRLIVLAGLVSVEKIELALDLAYQQAAAGQTVTVIDNVRHAAHDTAGWNGIERVRIEDDLGQQLLPVMKAVTSGVVYLAVADSVRPDDLFMLLGDVRDALPGVDIQTLALIDTRTCDCFPQLRLVLEAYADVVVHLPAEADDVMRQLA